ncbi:MAG: PilN domain-containing protein [Candidatus Nitricoxidivorans perseverans]|uniref:PilN domain-containing protein n=1 Tax=Candidatus Nitricoxidivorans perseverans TaxID=2975601 RepID=A0AA49ITS9_9PROT|nr:MAG: PilN domain-containing protein [Candidatus Nitricoxidivorans perseverans]
MIRINLLPHREEKRKARREQFYALGGLVTVLAGVTWFLGFTIINGQIDSQDAKNAFLKKEIDFLDKDIDEIKKLKEQTDALLSRKGVIESLQANRAETVYFFNELARRVPSGVYLRAVKQKGQQINLSGYAQSNARVSALMRSLDDSPVMEKPDLVEIKAATVDRRRLSEFSLNIRFTRQTSGEGKDKAGASGKGDKS